MLQTFSGTEAMSCQKRDPCNKRGCSQNDQGWDQGLDHQKTLKPHRYTQGEHLYNQAKRQKLDRNGTLSQQAACSWSTIIEPSQAFADKQQSRDGQSRSTSPSHAMEGYHTPQKSGQGVHDCEDCDMEGGNGNGSYTLPKCGDSGETGSEGEVVLVSSHGVLSGHESKCTHCLQRQCHSDWKDNDTVKSTTEGSVCSDHPNSEQNDGKYTDSSKCEHGDRCHMQQHHDFAEPRLCGLVDKEYSESESHQWLPYPKFGYSINTQGCLGSAPKDRQTAVWFSDPRNKNEHTDVYTHSTESHVGQDFLDGHQCSVSGDQQQQSSQLLHTENDKEESSRTVPAEVAAASPSAVAEVKESLFTETDTTAHGGDLLAVHGSASTPAISNITGQTVSRMAKETYTGLSQDIPVTLTTLEEELVRLKREKRVFCKGKPKKKMNGAEKEQRKKYLEDIQELTRQIKKKRMQKYFNLKLNSHCQQSNTDFCTTTSGVHVQDYGGGARETQPTEMFPDVSTTGSRAEEELAKLKMEKQLVYQGKTKDTLTDEEREKLATYGIKIHRLKKIVRERKMQTTCLQAEDELTRIEMERGIFFVGKTKKTMTSEENEQRVFYNKKIRELKAQIRGEKRQAALNLKANSNFSQSSTQTGTMTSSIAEQNTFSEDITMEQGEISPTLVAQEEELARVQHEKQLFLQGKTKKTMTIEEKKQKREYRKKIRALTKSIRDKKSQEGLSLKLRSHTLQDNAKLDTDVSDSGMLGAVSVGAKMQEFNKLPDIPATYTEVVEELARLKNEKNKFHEGKTVKTMTAEEKMQWKSYKKKIKELNQIVKKEKRKQHVENLKLSHSLQEAQTLGGLLSAVPPAETEADEAMFSMYNAECRELTSEIASVAFDIDELKKEKKFTKEQKQALKSLFKQQRQLKSRLGQIKNIQKRIRQQLHGSSSVSADPFDLLNQVGDKIAVWRQVKDTEMRQSDLGMLFESESESSAEEEEGQNTDEMFGCQPTGHRTSQTSQEEEDIIVISDAEDIDNNSVMSDPALKTVRDRRAFRRQIEKDERERQTSDNPLTDRLLAVKTARKWRAFKRQVENDDKARQIARDVDSCMKGRTVTDLNQSYILISGLAGILLAGRRGGKASSQEDLPEESSGVAAEEKVQSLPACCYFISQLALKFQLSPEQWCEAKREEQVAARKRWLQRVQGYSEEGKELGCDGSSVEKAVVQVDSDSD